MVKRAILSSFIYLFSIFGMLDNRKINFHYSLIKSDWSSVLKSYKGAIKH